MKYATYGIALGLVAATAASAPAQTTIAWKLKAGDKWAVEHQLVQAMALEAKNKPFQQKSVQTLATRWHVKEQRGDRYVIGVVVESMVSKTTTGDDKAVVESKDDAKWAGAEFVLTVDAQGRLHDVQGRDELLAKLAGGNPQLLKVWHALKPPETFHALFQDVLGPLPAKPVRPGERWSHTTKEAINLFGTFQFDTEFTFDGVKGGLEYVKTTTKTTYQGPRYAVENDVFRVLKGAIKTDDGAGYLLFDAGRGRMTHVERVSKTTGEVTLEVAGQRQMVGFTSDNRVSILIK
jgi:hypothetical protein